MTLLHSLQKRASARVTAKLELIFATPGLDIFSFSFSSYRFDFLKRNMGSNPLLSRIHLQFKIPEANDLFAVYLRYSDMSTHLLFYLNFTTYELVAFFILLAFGLVRLFLDHGFYLFSCYLLNSFGNFMYIEFMSIISSS